MCSLPVGSHTFTTLCRTAAVFGVCLNSRFPWSKWVNVSWGGQMIVFNGKNTLGNNQIIFNQRLTKLVGRPCSPSGPLVNPRYRPVVPVVLYSCSSFSTERQREQLMLVVKCAHYRLFALSVYFYLLMSDTFWTQVVSLSLGFLHAYIRPASGLVVCAPNEKAA